MRVSAFLDASNLFYGGEKSLGWKIDYQKLLIYLQTKYQVSQVFYFGGVEIHDFRYDYLTHDTVSLTELEKHLNTIIKTRGDELNEAQLLLLSRHVSRVRFYHHLERFGYHLFLKPVKLYFQEDGTSKRKANCDVDMAFHLMKEKESYDCAVVLSGDGDFLPVLKYLKENGKEIIVLGRGNRTAKEIRQFAGSNFRDFEYLRNLLRME